MCVFVDVIEKDRERDRTRERENEKRAREREKWNEYKNVCAWVKDGWIDTVSFRDSDHR